MYRDLDRNWHPEITDAEIPYTGEPAPGAEVEELYACPVGTALWEAYRLHNPNAPATPPDLPCLWPDPVAAPYFKHFGRCSLCGEWR